jgi:glucosylglycerate synthase
VDSESTLSDALVRQLVAVGQADVLVGLPTLNNAATIVDIVRSVHASFTLDFPRLRTVMINSDGGSTDGTPDLIRAAAFADEDRVQTSHSLRTLHRVVAPYHGMPGKFTALRTIFVAAELTQAKVLVILDPSGPATTRERVTELINPISRSQIAFLTPRYQRHPCDGVLVTQFVRPVIRALYGVGIDEPLSAEFSCTGRFAAHCLEQDIWDRETARFAIDLWLRTEAVAEKLSLAEIWRPVPTAAGVRATLREAVHQVVVSLLDGLSAHESFWLKVSGVAPLETLGSTPAAAPDHATWDYHALAAQARHDIAEIEPLIREVLTPEVSAQVMAQISSPDPPLDDELWVSVVYAFIAATRSGETSIDNLAGMLVPLYMWRASAFMCRAALEPPNVVQSRLDSLCQAFERLKPILVSSWSEQDVRSR